MRHLLTAAEAHGALGIPASTIRTWAQRHRIHSHGLDEHGRPMYDRDELIQMRDRRGQSTCGSGETSATR